MYDSCCFFFFFKQKTAYEMRISDWSSDVCSSDLLVRELDLVGNGARIAEEAQALLSAPQCPEAVTTLILGSEQMALQIHESVGHAIELDRILGWEEIGRAHV